ncbi:hypothetical protein [Leptolyngbya sp. 7M]|uniref:hypothetical protein n=1 Tax=Leptolyngbya sp. 7M TaxID=2812896 RepID=UPI001B8D1531|nr:hypothetical protein [Leptolyngbya sp. 7M]QYO62985.1 hypothetical protein JVX88_23725 [Leptolyngbya sp. 7M]
MPELFPGPLQPHPQSDKGIQRLRAVTSGGRGLFSRIRLFSPFSHTPDPTITPSEPTIKVLPRGADPFNPDSLVEIEGPIFLEIGSNTRTFDIDGNPEDNGAGLVHILAAHATDFTNQGIPEDRIVDAVVAAVTKGTDVGSQGKKVGRRIYEVNLGEALGIPGLGVRRIAVTVGDNGFIVGANPVSF